MNCHSLRIALFAGVILAQTSVAIVLGQGNTFNPYGNSGYADYREFTTPMYSNDPSLPGQARLQSGITGRNRANSFDSYVNSFDGSNADQFNANRGVSTGLPYYKAYQLYDKENKRAYRPNDTAADRLFQARVAERNAEYSKALEEKDPKKRALMLRRLDQDTINRPLGSITNQVPASRAGQRGTAKSATGTARQVAPKAARPRVDTPTTSKPASSTAAAAAPPLTTPTTAPITPVNPSTVPIPAPQP